MPDEPFEFKKSQKAYLGFKRFLDLFLSFLGILLLSWLLIILAIITKCTSKGPAFYKQTRIGKDEKLFTMYKFRSMKADTPAIAPNDMTEEEQSSMTTKWGRFIRKTSLDELPQLFNILNGNMSFIGPRPQQEKEKEEKCYVARMATNPNAFTVKPGLCSLAIIKMHRSHDPKEKAAYDSEYVRRVSFGLDARIFFTAIGILFGFRPKDRGH